MESTGSAFKTVLKAVSVSPKFRAEWSVESGALRAEHTAFQRGENTGNIREVCRKGGVLCIYIYILFEGGIKFSWDRESTRTCTRYIVISGKYIFGTDSRRRLLKSSFLPDYLRKKRGRNVVTLHFLCRGSAVTTTFIISDIFLHENVPRRSIKISITWLVMKFESIK